MGTTKDDGVKYQLLVDDFIVNGVTVGEISRKDLDLPTFYIMSDDTDFFTKLADLNLYEFRQARIIEIRLNKWTKWECLEISVGFMPSYFSQEEFIFEVEFEPDLVNWNFNYSFNDYYGVFYQIWENDFSENSFEYLRRSEKKHTFELKIRPVLNGLPITEEIDKNLEDYEELHRKTILQLNDKHFENYLLASFNFPETLKASCKQYLLYFAQFLQDLGIDTTSNLKEEAGKVLFSVTPTDDVEALDKIREALAVYLNLPASPIIYDESFAAMRLQQQIDNLQHSQKMAVREIRSAERELRLAQTVIEHQDKIIVQKDKLIEQQNKVIEKIQSKSIMMDSLENKEELEEIYDGLKIGESKFLKEQLGIHLNPAKVIKTVVKNTFGKDKKISIIDSDEESDK